MLILLVFLCHTWQTIAQTSVKEYYPQDLHQVLTVMIREKSPCAFSRLWGAGGNSHLEMCLQLFLAKPVLKGIIFLELNLLVLQNSNWLIYKWAKEFITNQVTMKPWFMGTPKAVVELRLKATQLKEREHGHYYIVLIAHYCVTVCEVQNIVL